MLSSYFIELHTGTDYEQDEYDAAAGRLCAMLVSIVSDAPTMSALTYNATRTSCHTEVEISLEPIDAGRELVAKAVVDITGDELIKLDKSKLTKLLKAHRHFDEWKKMKVLKKQVPQVEA